MTRAEEIARDKFAEALWKAISHPRMWKEQGVPLIAAALESYAKEERERICCWLEDQSSHGLFLAARIREGGDT